MLRVQQDLPVQVEEPPDLQEQMELMVPRVLRAKPDLQVVRGEPVQQEQQAQVAVLQVQRDQRVIREQPVRVVVQQEPRDQQVTRDRPEQGEELQGRQATMELQEKQAPPVPQVLQDLRETVQPDRQEIPVPPDQAACQG